MRRREFLAAGVVGGVALASPAILRAQVSSGTPAFNGKRVRRKLSSLPDNDPFFAAYGRAVELMHQQSDSSPLSWIAQARKHGDFCTHGELEFFPWHRPYLVMFERICGALINDPNFALPYWDWGDNNGQLPQPFFDGGPLNVFSWMDDGNYMGINWGTINSVPYRFARADFGMHNHPLVAGAFMPQNLKAMEEASNFQLLHDLTEGPHGAVHVFTGGDPNFNLGTARGHLRDGLSPLDPCFWLHHSNVDRVWAQSAIPVSDQKAVLSNAGIDLNKVYSGIFHDENGAAVSPILDDQFDLSNHDYIYDFMVPSLLSVDDLAVQQQIAAAQPNLRAFAEAKGLVFPQGPVETKKVASAAPFGANLIGGISRVDIEAKELGDFITTEKILPRNLATVENAISIGTKRVYARFKDVKPKTAADGNMIRVFVDCPYVSQTTPTNIPYFGGIINFFGCSPDKCLPRDFTIDITEPLKHNLKEGALKSKIQLQLVALSGDVKFNGAQVAEFGEVELITA